MYLSHYSNTHALKVDNAYGLSISLCDPEYMAQNEMEFF